MQEIPTRQKKTQDTEQQIQLKRQQRALKKSQTQVSNCGNIGEAPKRDSAIRGPLKPGRTYSVPSTT